MSSLKLNVSFAIEDLKVNQEKSLAYVSESKHVEAVKNKVNRLKRAESFAKLSDNVLMFIVTHCNEDTLEELVRSDNKDSICNYKTAQRIADLACLLSNESSAQSIKLAYSNILAFKAKYENLECIKCSLNETLRVIHKSNDSYAKNVLKALYFFNLVECNSKKRKNEKFIDVFSQYDTIIIK